MLCELPSLINRLSCFKKVKGPLTSRQIKFELHVNAIFGLGEGKLEVGSQLWKSDSICFARSLYFSSFVSKIGNVHSLLFLYQWTTILSRDVIQNYNLGRCLQCATLPNSPLFIIADCISKSQWYLQCFLRLSVYLCVLNLVHINLWPFAVCYTSLCRQI